MKILYQYASRSRPQRFFEGLFNILEYQEDKQNFWIHCVLDEDDPTVDEQFIDKVEDLKIDYRGDILWNFGRSTGKINAINRQLPDVNWDILVNFSDDMRFIFKGFDQVIRSAFEIHGMDSFIHFPDQDAKAALATMSIIGRPYFNRDNSIYHSSYISLWADNEAMEVARRRGCYHYDPARLFNHELPATGYGKHDAQSIHQQLFFEEDMRNYQKRLALNFDL
jgi:hypothetical protein